MSGAGTRRAARASGVAAIFAGVAIGLLQGLQGLVGSFNPRWEATALIAVAVLGGSLWLQRVNARSKERDEASERGELVRRSVAAWPIPTLEAPDPLELGVFPTRRDEPETPYIPRRIDDELRPSIERCALVVVVGPARAGKSRSALHCAREALARDAAVIAPRDAGALRQLLDVDPRLRFAGLSEGPRVLWLDGLERFTGAIDAALLDRLGRPEALPAQSGFASALLRRPGRGNGSPTAEVDPPLTLVASVRADRWEALLVADGADAEAVRAIVARGRVLRLPLELAPEPELAQAGRLYPQRDFSAGIGPALASRGDEAPYPTAPPDASGDQTEPEPIGGPPPVREDRAVLVPALVSAAALLIVALLALTDSFERRPPPTIAEQAAEARREGSAGPRIVIDAERVDFRGSGQPSYFFGFGDAPNTPAAERRSHELQVWDQHGDELEREFGFEPRGPAVFQFRFIGDIDGDGADELVGGFGDLTITGELLLPFALDWDDDAERYRLISLAPEAPELATRPRGPDAEDPEGLRGAYAQRFVLRDVEGKQSLAGHRTQDFTVTENPIRLVSAYATQVRRAKRDRLLELQAFNFDRTGGVPRMRRCQLADAEPVLLRAPGIGRRPLHNAMLERWLEASKDRFCVAVFD